MIKQGAPLQALGAHCLDLYRLLTFSLDVPHSYSKFRQLDAVRKKTGARMMIETGTAYGITAQRCGRVFEKVYTIELDPALAAQATARLAGQPNVQVVLGDAVEKLPAVLATEGVDDALVFLDGHFSGGVTALGDLPEPAILEIDTVAKYQDKIRAVIIDDFRCFGINPGWPRKSELLGSIERSLGHRFDIAVHIDQVILTRQR